MPTEAELETAQKRLFKRYVWFTLLALLFVVGLFLLLGFASANASATTYNWDGGDGANQLASDADNWDPDGVPITGDVVTVDGTNDEAITWDLGGGVVIVSYDQGAGYSGTLTTSSIFNCSGAFHLHGGTFVQGAFAVNTGSVTMDGGTLTSVETSILTVSGGFTKTGGTLTSYKTYLKMTGTGVIYTSNAEQNFHRFEVTGSCTVSKTFYINSVVAGWGMSNSGTVAISSGQSINYVMGTAGADMNNAGVINGPGTLCFGLQNAHAITPGTVNAPVQIYNDNINSNLIATLTTNTAFGGTLTVISNHVTKTMTLDLNGNSLSATTITASTRGIISSSVAGAKLTATGAITVSANGQLDATNIAWISCGTNWDSSAGTWTPGTNQVNMTSVYKAVKLAAGQTFYDLQLINNTNVTGQASVTHLIKYSGMGANLHYHWLNATSIGDYQSNASGLIDIAGRILYVANLYRMEVYFLPPTITNTAPLSILIYHTYYYNATADQPGTWSIVEGASWLTESSNQLTGMPDRTQLSPVPVQVTLSNVNGTAYYNFTVTPYGWAATFTTTAPTVVLIGETYIYYPQSNTTTVLSIVTYPAWMSLVGGDHLTGMGVYPGNYSISIRTNCSGGLYAYQNYTVSVFASSMVLTNPAGMDVQSIMFIVMLVLLTAVSFLDKRVMFLGGMLWMCGSLFVWYDLYSFMFYIGIGAGLYFLLNGAMEYV